MADWEALAIMAAFIAVLVSALLLMLSRILDFKILEQSAKAELVFAASSVILVIFLIGAVKYGTDIGKTVSASMYLYSYQHVGELHFLNASGQEQVLDTSIFSSPDYTLNEIVILYMRSVMYCAESVGNSAFYVSLAAHQISSFSQDVWMAYPISAWAWGGIAQAADNLLNTFYFMELVYRIQIYVMRFMDVFSLSYLLPIGILMRSFPPTRAAGAYVLAFTIGVYLVFPIAYLAAVFSSPYPALCATPQLPEIPQGESSKAGILSQLVMWYRAFEGDLLDFVDKFSDFTNSLLINLCFFPFLAFAIMITFVQSSSGLFGANVSEVGRGLIKLI